MDPLIYFFAEYFPWWGIPTILILAELANHFRRIGSKVLFVGTALLCLLMAALCLLYFVNNGFHNLIPAMQNFEKKYGK